MINTFKIAIILTVLCSPGYAQNQLKADSLKHELTLAKQDSIRAFRLIDLSNIYQNTKPDSSIYYGLQALTLLQNTKYFPNQVPALLNLSIEFRVLGDVGKAMEAAFKGLQIAEEKKDGHNTAHCLNQLGTIYMISLQDYSKAIQYFRQSNQLSDELHDEEWNAFMVLNIASAHRRNKQFDSAFFYDQKAYATFKKLDTAEHIPLLFLQMGATQFGLNNYPLALEYLHKGLHISQEQDDVFYGSIAFYRIAEVFQAMKQKDSCIWFTKQSLADANKINFKQQILDATTLLAQLYESRNVDSAYYYLKLAKTANDEVNGPAKKLELQKTITDEQERQRKVEAETMAYQTQLKQYIFLAGLGILLLIAFILYRNNKQKQKANKVLETTLTNLKSTQAQLIQSEKMASLGELTAGIAHEIQNPLNFVNNFSEVSNELIDEMNEELNKGDITEAKAISADIKQNLEKINHHGKRAEAIVKGMLQHSQSSSGTKEPTDINKLADEYLRLAYHGLSAKDKSFNATTKTDFDESIGNIHIIPQDIGRVLLNLINNAFYAVNEKKKSAGTDYEPTVTLRTQKLGDKFLISVKDNGNGIPQKIADKIFQPFFTTKPTGQGTGLGLSLSYDIIKAHGGEIKVETKEGEGTIFIIQLPI